MALPPNRADPIFWIFAGPNGSGKSTAYSRAVIGDELASIWIVNPDLLTLRLRAAEAITSESANLEAVTRVEAWLEATLRVHKSVGVETVLSTRKYRRLVEVAHSLGFVLRLFYVLLDSPELNVERVRARVLQGGHDVPEDKIRSRYWRSLEQLPWFLQRADVAEIFDNSGAEPKLVGRKAKGELILAPTAPQNLLAALGVG